jgi:hypothetical protein
MNQPEEFAPLVEVLTQTKTKMISLAGKLASDDKWDLVNRWARSLGELTQEMAGAGGLVSYRARTNNFAHTQQAAGIYGAPPFGRRGSQPHFFINPDEKLVMQGRSRNGGFYKHRVVKPHYDLIVQKVAKLARENKMFYSQDLQDRREMPVHEPLLVVRLLTSSGLITKLQKGRFALKDVSRFLADATELWSRLPRENDQ